MSTTEDTAPVKAKSIEVPSDVLNKIGADVQKALAIRAECARGDVLVLHEFVDGERTGSFIRCEITHAYKLSPNTPLWIASLETTHYHFEGLPDVSGDVLAQA